MPSKQKILLAVGERSLENFLTTRLADEYTFVQEASYREIVIRRIKEGHPDIVLLREALKGSMTIENLVLDIRESYPDVRIVFYTSKYRPGEPLLRKLVSYGVYDFIAGESVSESQIFDAIKNKKQLSDVRQYLDAPGLTTDEPAMSVTTEYKDLSGPAKPEPEYEKINKVPEREEGEEPEKKGLIGRIFGGKKKKEKPKKKDSKKDKKKSAIEIEDDPDEEEDFWADESNEEEETPNPSESLTVPEVKKPKDENITLGNQGAPGYNNPLPMFGQSPVEQQPKQAPVQKPVEQAPPKQAPPVQTSPVVEENYGAEEDLFESPQPVVQEQPQQPDDRLTIPARGKPSADNISLHQKELSESGRREDIQPVSNYIEPEPQIDFNPMEMDEPRRADVAQQPIQQQSSQTQKPVRHEPIEHNEEHSVGWFGRRNSGKISVGNKKIITFVSAVHGSGNTHVAFNSALKLADEGNRVLYLDMNPTFSSIDFSFQLGTWQQGIDKALEDIEYSQGMNVSGNILKIKEIKKNRKEKQFQELYKALPDTLDYMFYSQDYQTLEEQHPVPKDRLKDLVMYLATRENYDVVIIDSEPLGEVGVDGLLNIANKIYITMTQDPGQMGVFHRQFDAAKKRVNITDERFIVVNQFVNTEPKVKRVQKWTNETVLQTVPFTHKGVIQANYLGEPFILKTKHQPAINAFESLAEHIAE